jgi:uncharacterized phage protein (TIGR01671 family)
MNTRNIKFRVWDNTRNEFIRLMNPRCICESMERILITMDGLLFSRIDHDFLLEDTKRFTLQQFTGVLDAKGKEIYEGDLIKIDAHYEGDSWVESSTEEVKFDDGSFCSQTQEINSVNVHNYNITIAGNVYNHCY